jgi:serine/threonine protein kinase
MTGTHVPERYMMLLAHMQATTGLELQPELLVSDRRGAAVLRLTDGTRRYALKLVERQEPLTQEFYEPLALLRREARLLAALDDLAGGQYIAHDQTETAGWLLANWLEGRHAMAVCRALRQQHSIPELQRQLCALFSAILRTVSALHERGYVHGDLQPSHLLQRSDSSVALLDLALTHGPADPLDYYGGMLHFLAPETARALLTQSGPVPLAPSAEVYAVAAVLFFLYTGEHIRAEVPGGEAPGSRECFLQTLGFGRVRSIAETGAAPFPALEQTLAWCLQPDPQQRCARLVQAADLLVRESETDELHRER